MLVYMKIVEGVKKLFGTLNNIPAESDKELVYKNADGDALSVVPGDQYLDDGNGGIIRKSDNSAVVVQIDPAEGDDVTIIPPVDPFESEEVEAGKNSTVSRTFAAPLAVKTLTSISVTGFKTSYNVGDTLDISNVVVKAKYDDGSEQVVDNYTVDPSIDHVLTESDNSTYVTFSYTENDITKTTRKKITVA